jgi:GT2 family glycosyltransferase
MSVERQARSYPSRRIAAIDHPTAEARIEAVTFLGASFALALVSGAALPRRGAIRARRVAGDGAQRLHGTRISLGHNGADTDIMLILLQPTAKNETLATSGTLLLDGDTGAVALEPSEFADATVSAERFGSTLLATLDVRDRAAVVAQIISRVAAKAGALGDASQSLSVLQGAVRERLPVAETVPSADCAARVEGLWRVDNSAFYVEGWVLDRRALMNRLQLLAPEGLGAEILQDAVWYPRPDVSDFFGLPAHEKLGFIDYVALPQESLARSGWIMQARRADGTGFEVELPPVTDDPIHLRNTILGDLELDGSPTDALLRDHISPALTRLEKRLSETIRIETIDQHGVPPRDPDVTLVVPLYRRTEFLEHQLAQFVHDPDIHVADLIYVLDSPEDSARLRPFAGHLFDLYRVPFRLVTLTATGGFSVVNNLGASLARGRLLLLLNSDVLPGVPGWLRRMVEFYDAHPTIGALAPKLLYEDESIQHAGLYFYRPPGGRMWSNEHYYKGLHRFFPAANVSRSVPAVTGACMLLATELYQSSAGLRGIYVRGDYEDSDLCLRLREQGRECWYLSDVELYHLEGQSYPRDERERASQYNQWLHSHLWTKELGQIEGHAQ